MCILIITFHVVTKLEPSSLHFAVCHILLLSIHSLSSTLNYDMKKRKKEYDRMNHKRIYIYIITVYIFLHVSCFLFPYAQTHIHTLFLPLLLSFFWQSIMANLSIFPFLSYSFHSSFYPLLTFPFVEVKWNTVRHKQMTFMMMMMMTMIGQNNSIKVCMRVCVYMV